MREQRGREKGVERQIEIMFVPLELDSLVGTHLSAESGTHTEGRARAGVRLRRILRTGLV